MGVWKHECLWPKNKNGKKQEKVKGQESLRENSAFQKVCCQDHWTLLHLPPMPWNWSVFTDRIWAEPVHEDTEMETRMKTSICFQRPEKLERKKKKSSTDKCKIIFSFNTYEHIFLLTVSLENNTSRNECIQSPDKHPNAWPCSQKQITSFRALWSLMRETCTAMYWTHLWLPQQPSWNCAAASACPTPLR